MDHIKLAKERDRMCDEISKGTCRSSCPLSDNKDCVRTGYMSTVDACKIACMRYPEESVAIISKWRAENPEPRLPTWREWFLTFLPEVPSVFETQFKSDSMNVRFVIAVRDDRVSYNEINLGNGMGEHAYGSLDCAIRARMGKALGAQMITPKGDKSE